MRKHKNIASCEGNKGSEREWKGGNVNIKMIDVQRHDKFDGSWKEELVVTGDRE